MNGIPTNKASLRKLTPRRLVRGLARRLGLHRIWIPGIRPYDLATQGREFIPCHACGEVGYRAFIRDPQHQVVRCVRCGLYYVNPVPNAAALKKQVHGSAVYTEDQLLKRSFFRRRAEHLFDRVETQLAPGRLLDIGCAIGTELEVGRERGWNGVGIELAESSVELARNAGLDVYCQELAEIGFDAGSFDLITMNHVLEHVAHSSIFMEEIRRIISKDGLLFISLPNVHAWKFYFRRGNYAWTFHNEHYIHFSVATLPKFLRRYGFCTVEITAPRWLDFHDPIESRPWWFQAINTAIEELKLGIEIFCLARPVLK